MKKINTKNLQIATGRRAEILLHFASQNGKAIQSGRPHEMYEKLWGGYSELFEILVLTFEEEILNESQLTLINEMIKSVLDNGGELDIINVGSGYLEIEFWGSEKLTDKSLEIVFEFLEQHNVPYYFNWRLSSTGLDIVNAIELLENNKILN
jgi:hypothetical protein